MVITFKYYVNDLIRLNFEKVRILFNFIRNKVIYYTYVYITHRYVLCIPTEYLNPYTICKNGDVVNRVCKSSKYCMTVFFPCAVLCVYAY